MRAEKRVSPSYSRPFREGAGGRAGGRGGSADLHLLLGVARAARSFAWKSACMPALITPAPSPRFPVVVSQSRPPEGRYDLGLFGGETGLGSLSPNRGGGEVRGGGGRGRARALSLSAGLALPAGWSGLRRSPQRRHVERSGGPSLGGAYQRHSQRCGSGHWQVFLGPGCLSTYRDFAAAPILFVLSPCREWCRYVGQGPAGQTAAGRGLWPKTRSDLFRMAVQGALGCTRTRSCSFLAWSSQTRRRGACAT